VRNLPFDIFSETPEEAQERLAEEQALRTKRGLIEAERELYDHPAWRHFMARLERIENSAKEQLVNCEPEDLAGIRARIRLARELMQVPDKVRADAQGVADLIRDGEVEDA
jgi:hypothetical protein